MPARSDPPTSAGRLRLGFGTLTSLLVLSCVVFSLRLWVVYDHVEALGAGIEADVLPHVFEAFEQGGAAVTRRFGGLGLGLAISKGLAELHGGALSAHSDGLGRGATFRLVLPRADAGSLEGDPTLSGQAPASTGAAPLRVLVVEDHPDKAALLTRMLQELGHEASVAPTAARAAELSAAEHFDLVVGDLGLPDGSGYELMGALIRPGMRGIALSGFGRDDDVRRSLEAGFVAHLTKPLDPDQLASAIEAVFSSEPLAAPG